MIELHAHDILDYKTCPRMYYYRRVVGLQSKAPPSTSLLVGTGFHLAVGAYYRTGRDAAKALAVCDLWAAEERGRGVEDEAAFALAKTLVGYYVEYAKANDTFEVYAVEERFRVPVWTPRGRRSPGVVFCGTFDGIVRDQYGRLRLLEHKTAREFPPHVVLTLDEQAGLYLLAANQLFDEPVDSVLYNVIRKVDPQRARKEMITRYYVTRNNHELRRLRDRLYYHHRQMRRDKLFLPSPGQHCGWKCAYAQLCTAEEAGLDARYIEQAFYEPAGEQPSWADRLDTLLEKEAKRRHDSGT